MDRAGDILEHRGEHRIAPRRHRVDGAARPRREKQRIARQHLGLDKGHHGERHERALFECLAAARRRPVVAQREDDIAAGDAAHDGTRRQGQLHRRAVRQDVIIFGGEERHRADDERDRAIRTAGHDRICEHVACLSLEHRLGRFERFAAMPELDDARIARRRRRAGAEIGGEQDGVVIDIAGAGLGDRQCEPAAHELAGVDIVFADFVGIAAAGR
jgi:hypothetical protein